MKVKANVAEPNIPLLLSRNSMKNGSMMINFFEDTVMVFREILKLTTTRSGHFTIPLFHAPNNLRVHTVLLKHDKDDKAKTAQKLHRQFAHLTAEKLKKLLIAAGRKHLKLLPAVDETTRSYDTCLRYSRPHPRPVRSTPMTSVFNETVSADLKYFNGIYFLVLVDMCTRSYVADGIQNEKPGTILNVFFPKWITLFGATKQFLNVNGAEFDDKDIRFLADRFKTKQKNFISNHIQYIEKYDHPTWMTISKFKNMIMSKIEKHDHQTWIIISDFKIKSSNT